MQRGETGVVPTDTLYGVVGSALRPAIVEGIYELRQRERDKPLIVLIGEPADLALFKAKTDDRTQELFNKVWPGPVSIIVQVLDPEFAYLHRGTQSVAFRLPAKAALRELLRQTGPLVAPSANLAGEPSATTLNDAWQYFGDNVFYLDEGPLNGAASALVDARTNPLKILRPAPGFRI